MSAIGKGDWVECIQNRTPQTLPPVGLVVGRIYRVEAVGETPPEDENPHVPWVRLEGCPQRDGKLGFRLAWFRPAGRGGMFADLLSAQPDRVGEPA